MYVSQNPTKAGLGKPIGGPIRLRAIPKCWSIGWAIAEQVLLLSKTMSVSEGKCNIYHFAWKIQPWERMKDGNCRPKMMTVHWFLPWIVMEWLRQGCATVIIALPVHHCASCDRKHSKWIGPFLFPHDLSLQSLPVFSLDDAICSQSHSLSIRGGAFLRMRKET